MEGRLSGIVLYHPPTSRVLSRGDILFPSAVSSVINSKSRRVRQLSSHLVSLTTLHINSKGLFWEAVVNVSISAV